MKRFAWFTAVCCMLLAFASCKHDKGESGSSDDSSLDNYTEYTSIGTDLGSFDIDFDTTPLSETETVPTGDEDFIENYSVTSQVYIVYNGSSATVTGNPTGVTATISGANVVINSTIKGVEYIVTGTSSNGSLKVYSDKKYQLTLNGVTLTNPYGAAINDQSGKRVYVNCVEGTENSLCDGSNYTATTDGEDMKGCLFSEGKLLFSGKGKLNVTGNYKHAICADDYVRFHAGCNLEITANANSGVKANDSIIVGGGVLNISVPATAGKGLSCDAGILISGGRTTVITTGNGEYDSDDMDVSACAGIKADGVFTMTGGTIALKSSGSGGKGLSTDGNIVISGGITKVITTGQTYQYSKTLDALPKGIKSDANVTINGGNVIVRTSGGEGSEGIESKNVLTINDGVVEVAAYDDCINASTKIVINGGKNYCYSSNNDAIDSNGTLYVNGGITVAVGTNIPEDGFDCDNNTFGITGGILFGIGGSTSSPTTSACTQPSLIYNGKSGSTGDIYSIVSSDDECLLSYEMPRSYTQMSILASTNEFTKGNSYSLVSGGTLTGGTEFHGLIIDGTLTYYTSIEDFTMSSMVTTIGSSNGSAGGGPGGGGPGGGGPGGNW